jgi:hypothetical protein
MITSNLDGSYKIVHPKFTGKTFASKALATAAIIDDLSVIYSLLQSASAASERAVEACDRMIEVEEKIAARFVRAAAQV